MRFFSLCLLIFGVQCSQNATESVEEKAQESENKNQWLEWGECSKKCGGGIRIRTGETCEEECITGRVRTKF